MISTSQRQWEKIFKKQRKQMGLTMEEKKEKCFTIKSDFFMFSKCTAYYTLFKLINTVTVSVMARKIKTCRPLRHTHLGEELSLRRRVLRWKREGARQTARLVGVIWFSATLAVTSLSRHSSVRRASLFSSGSSSTAARAAWRRSSLGISGEGQGGCYGSFLNIVCREGLTTTVMLHHVIFFKGPLVNSGRSLCMASLHLPGKKYHGIFAKLSALYKPTCVCKIQASCFTHRTGLCHTLYKQFLMQLLQS